MTVVLILPTLCVMFQVFSLRAANIRNFKTEIYRNSKYKNSRYYKAAKLWDVLPRHVRETQTLYELKCHLKLVYVQFDDNFFNFVLKSRQYSNYHDV